ncbi:site-specific integrase [Pseudomonas sp. MWU12-2323]|uniref:tyrosine-type recombinase/integrase n=1 Tax=Pseudomonas sp. MWU12-2323 TaxID=2651296 RepID=UPI002113ADE7|nr:site-specific integrase [Pseudomonas sp. MWU12-2323]
MNTKDFRPIPLIDTHKKFTRSEAGEYEDDRPFLTEYLNHFKNQFDARADYDAVRRFLKSNSGVETTFNNYRTQVERLLLWAWNKRGMSFLSFRRSDVEAFMDFCRKPDASWISTSIKSRFLQVDGLYEPNPEWRPFHMRTEKSNAKSAIENNRDVPAPTFQMAGSSVRQVYAVINSLFTYCTADRVMDSNPCVLIKRDKQKWDTKTLTIPKQKALSRLQWEFVLETAELMASESPPVGERTLFCIVMMFGCYLRVSDLVGNGQWKPAMGSFVREGEGWYYHVVGKGNVQDKIAVRPDCMLYLSRYREFRELSKFPAPGDSEPLLRTLRGRPGLTSRQVRDDVQAVFDRAVERMKQDAFPDYEISALRAATLHWFRHTGATFDAPYRSPKNLQADMRHKSLATTQNIYYNTLNDERTAEVAKLSLRR